MFFKRIIAVLCGIVMLVLCACTPLTPTVSAETTNAIPQYSLPPIEEDPVPTGGGDLIFPIPKNPETLNPLKIRNVELFNLFTLIYEQPIRIGDDGTAQPELAETWEVDESGMVWTFHLREGVEWQKGYGEMTSEDVLYTLGLLQSYSADKSKYAQYNSILTAFTALDDYTVTLTMSEPGNAAIYLMTFPVMCKAYCETGNTENLMPLGTGPYSVISYDDEDKMLLEASSVWWKTPPYIKQLTAKCYANHDFELAAFKHNLLDFITTSILTVDTYKQYGEIVSLDYLTAYYDCLVPNAATGLFSDTSIRQAVAYALDKRDIISTALLGHAVATDYPVMPDSYLAGESANIYEYNLQKATALLAEAGWEDRDDDGISEKVEGTAVLELTVEIMILADEDDTYRRDVAENIVAQLRECGIDTVIAEEEAAVYMNRLNSGSFEIALCSFYLDENPDISFMVGTGESKNYGDFSDMTLDALLQNCRMALDEAAMHDAYLAMEGRFIETVPQISLYYRTNALIYKTSINIYPDFTYTNIFTTIPFWYLYTEDTVPEGIEEEKPDDADQMDMET